MSTAPPSLLRRATTPRWLGWWAVALLASIAFFYLGQWQWGRYEDKAARADRVERHYTADPRPVTDVLGSTPVDLSAAWTRVEATGTYEDDDLLVRNRPRDSRYGYEVLSPLRLTDGRVVAVDRGWIPNSDEGATVAPPVPSPPPGVVTVTGWVRTGEPSLHREPPPGQLASINLREASEAWDEPVLGGYVVRQSESPAASDATPQDLDAPETGVGPHMAYAIQWWLAIPAAFWIIWFALRREHRETGGAGTAAPDRATGPKKAKVRVWDEEDG